MSCLSEPRYEALPLRRGEGQAAAIPTPVGLTVSTSPRRGAGPPLGGPGNAEPRLHHELGPHLGDPGRTIPGCHSFTFNGLPPTWRWRQEPGRRKHVTAATREA